MRCAQCVMLDRVPGSDFDENGVCRWCRAGYPDYRPLGIDRLRALIAEKRRPDSEVDCVVGISGGKDSSFAVWAMRKHFGLRVEAFTYEHSGSSPLARDNARAVCASLGVNLTVTSLGPEVHLKAFRDYFTAWLDRPSTVTAGMICVACKHLHVVGCELAARKRAPLVVWAKCPLEDSPFLALKNTGEGTRREGLIKGSALLAGEMLKSRRLLTAIGHQFPMSVQGCLAFAPSSPYLKWRYPSVEQISLFEYWPWSPTEIYRTLNEETGWRKPDDCASDWHSDCIFNVFKEYVFQSMLGASYTDGFLSNQIRAGLLSRDQALAELLESKRHFARILPEALQRVGLGDYADRVDASCFSVAE